MSDVISAMGQSLLNLGEGRDPS